ncbi:MAG: hypothetical protein AB7F96_03235 [Beijerinckiaceae bacterium]
MIAWFSKQKQLADGPQGPSVWARFLRWFGAGLGALLAFALGAVFLFDPYGLVPFSLPFKRDLVDLNQRYFYPLVLRQGQYDSFIAGTSTIRLVDPKALDPVLDGRFANLGMNAATAWEQWKLLDLQLREKGKPKNLVIGLDMRWCDQKADTPEGRLTERGFPDFIYDGNRWNDLLYLLNGKTLEIVGRAIGVKLGWREPRYREDGYRIFTPPEAVFDLARVRLKLWPDGKPVPLKPVKPPVVLTQQEQQALSFPAVDRYLKDILARTRPQTHVVLVWTPAHRSRLPIPGSRDDAEEAVCKARAEKLAQASGAMIVDWRYISPLTVDDTKFWDAFHYRLPIAGDIVNSIRDALAGTVRDPGGLWVRRTPPGWKNGT